jgi:hypothetical protein
LAPIHEKFWPLLVAGGNAEQRDPGPTKVGKN